MYTPVYDPCRRPKDGPCRCVAEIAECELIYLGEGRSVVACAAIGRLTSVERKLCSQNRTCSLVGVIRNLRGSSFLQILMVPSVHPFGTIKTSDVRGPWLIRCAMAPSRLGGGPRLPTCKSLVWLLDRLQNRKIALGIMTAILRQRCLACCMMWRFLARARAQTEHHERKDRCVRS